jgi:uncharacterized protein (TIGR00251 family)
VIIKVRVTPKASRKYIKEDNGAFRVYLTSPAHDGFANKQLKELLAGHFKVKKYQISIVAGEKSRDKLVKIAL